MNYSSGAPVRQPVPELPENDFPVTPVPEVTQDPNQKTVVSLRLLWGNRGWLSRVALYAALASTLVAFLMPSRYESTTRLMPPDNQPSSALAMAAAAMTGGAGGLGGLGGIKEAKIW